MSEPLPEVLREAMRDWLPRQRWFGGKGRPIAGIAASKPVVLLDAEPRLEHRILTVDYADGGSERYQLLLGSRTELPRQLEHAAIGAYRHGTAYDGAHDSELTHLLLQLLASDATEGPLTFRHPANVELTTELRGIVMGAEQSNTSVVFGEEYILKLFRKIAPGSNPDLEVTRTLTAAGCPYVAPPLGWIETELAGEPTTLAMMQPYFRSASEGWALAVTSVRDLYAEGDLHADEVGGDFAAESHRLGVATAEVHALMARTLPSRVAGVEENALTAKQMHERLDAAREAVPQLAPYTDALRAAFDELAAYPHPVPVQRIHGDYHLGQVLRTDSGWILLDFEGEPARPLSERIALSSPLRDVAGMLRSFDYAARHLLAEQPTAANLEYRAGEWAERNREAFCDGYAQGCGRDPRADSVLLRAFELDKVVYEVVYEARNRPTWLPIPLGSIERLVG